MPPLNADKDRWTDRTDYAACQNLADDARRAGLNVVKYASARIASGVNLALLTCGAFLTRQPEERQTWRMHLGPHGARALCDFPEARLEFNREAFAADPRIAAFEWER